MAKIFYYKDISGDNESLNIQLEAAKEYHKELHDSCRQMEKKAQFILTSSLTMLTIFFAIATFISKQSINNIECTQSSDIITILNSFAILISLLIVIAAIYAIRTFKPKSYFVVGDEKILELYSNPHQKLVASHLSCAGACSKMNKYKSQCLKKSYNLFKIIICLMFGYICCTLYNWDNVILSCILLGTSIFIFIVELIHVSYLFLTKLCKKINACIKPLNKLVYDSRIKEIAYKISQKYPDNTPEENWYLAEEKFQLDEDI